MSYYRDYNYMERVENQRIIRNARVKQVRRQKLVIGLGIFITILLCTIFSIRAFVYASDNNTSNSNKMYKSVMIYCGDSVNSIAHDNITYGYKNITTLENEIRSINHLSNDEILIPGNYVVVPYFN